MECKGVMERFPIDSGSDNEADRTFDSDLQSLLQLRFFYHLNDKREISIERTRDIFADLAVSVRSLVDTGRADALAELLFVGDDGMAVDRIYSLDNLRKIRLKGARRPPRNATFTLAITINALHAYLCLKRIPVLLFCRHGESPHSTRDLPGAGDGNPC
jgi:hypothetical protein